MTHAPQSTEEVSVSIRKAKPIRISNKTVDDIVVKLDPDCTYSDSCEGHYYCVNDTKVCMSGWTGDNCETRDIAEGNRDTECPRGYQRQGCKNGGTCWDRTCCCLAGYEGNVCQVEILECASDPCGAGGTCKEGIDEYECICPEGK